MPSKASDDERDVRAEEIIAMARSGDPSVVPKLIEIAMTDTGLHAKMALDALGHMGEKARDAAVPLSRFMVEMIPRRWWLAACAARSLGRIGSGKPEVIWALEIARRSWVTASIRRQGRRSVGRLRNRRPRTAPETTAHLPPVTRRLLEELECRPRRKRLRRHR